MRARRRRQTGPAGAPTPGTTKEMTMKDTFDDHRKEVALFRYGLISEALHLPPDEAARHLKRQSRRELAIPGSARRTVAVTTMQAWLLLTD